ncbi:MAG TPA: ABC transporter permease [Gemmatimonadaceae bacterium]|nr:ABC transporter permease [Gemmatimonadaceae bacterium]
MRRLLQDLTYAVRRLARAPGFSVGAALLLAIGIGANVALFAATDALLLRPRPGVRDADRLVWVSTQSRGRGQLSQPDLDQLRTESGAFESVAGFRDDQFTVAPSPTAPSVRLRGQAVTGEFFSMLRARMQLGRPLLPSDDRVEAPLAVVLGNGMWMRQFGGSNSVVGRRIFVNGRPAIVVGVAEAGFNGADVDEPRHLWVAVSAMYGRVAAGEPPPAWLATIGRLRDGITPQAADAALGVVARRIASADTAARGFDVRTYPAETGVPPGGAMKLLPIAGLCLAVTFALLLIACANLSNLLLARGIMRQREIAVRMAMGASRGRVVSQLLVEAALLGAIGAVLGTILATWAIDAFNAAGMLPVAVEAVLDVRVTVAVVSFALAATLLVGVAPAFDATRRDVNAGLKDGAHGLDRRRARTQHGLVIAQVALSVVLLVTAGLFVASLRKQERFELGFDTSDHVLSVAFNVDELGFSPARRDAFARQLRERAAGMPGVLSVAYADQLPLGELTVSTEFAIDSARGSLASAHAFRTSVEPRYFSILGIGIRGGRSFTDDDRRGAEPVVIVSEAFARMAWPSGNAIGRRFTVGRSPGTRVTVVGVAADAYVWGAQAEAPRPLLYFPKAQDELGLGTHLLVRTARDARQLIPAIEREARLLDPAVPLFRVQTMAQYRNDRLGDPRNASRLMAIFGALALALATFGLYAVLSFGVQQRRREIGVRVAFGARSGDVVALFVRRGARLVGTGLVIGLVVAFGAARLVRFVLFGVGGLEAAAVALPVSALIAVALVAAWIPARRAARVDPMVALRSE